MSDLLDAIVFAHAGLSGLPDHESLMFLMPALPLMFIGTVLVAKALESRGLLQAGTVSLTEAFAAIAAALSLAAAAIHFSVIAEHLALDLGYGLLFIGLAWFQAIWAQVYLLRRSATLGWAAAVVNLGVVIVWIVSRTTGLPFGPTPWVPEAIGTVDLFATAFEMSLVAILLPTIAPQRLASLSIRRIAHEQAFVLGAFCVLTVALLATVALLGTPAAEPTR